MHYLMALFGSVIYNFALFVKAKDNCDKMIPAVDFEYKKYFKMNWDNWGLTFLLAPVVVWFMPAFAKIGNEWLTKTVGFALPDELYYLMAGPLTEVVMFGVLYIAGRKDSFVPPVHKE